MTTHLCHTENAFTVNSLYQHSLLPVAGLKIAHPTHSLFLISYSYSLTLINVLVKFFIYFTRLGNIKKLVEDYVLGKCSKTGAVLIKFF